MFPGAGKLGENHAEKDKFDEHYSSGYRSMENHSFDEEPYEKEVPKKHALGVSQDEATVFGQMVEQGASAGSKEQQIYCNEAKS